MKVKDARAILNSKKRQKLQRQRNFNSPRGNIVDARQILKSKRRNNSRPSAVGAPVALVKKELSHVFKSRMNTPGHWNIRKNMLLSDKRVQVEKGGILTVTSKGDITSRNTKNTEKMDIDNADDLETTTLSDFPEIKVLPQGLTPSLKTSYQSSFLQRTPWKPSTSGSFTGQTSNQTNTMVADTVAPSSSSTSAHCVLVTNLHHSVTREDVMELFGDIGRVTNAQLLEPGTALVSYFTKNEAIQAYDTYHNRLLDGQPMQCAIMQSNTPSVRSPLSSRLGEKLAPVGNRIPPPVPLASPSASRAPSSHFQYANTLSSSKSSNRSVQFTVRMP